MSVYTYLPYIHYLRGIHVTTSSRDRPGLTLKFIGTKFLHSAFRGHPPLSFGGDITLKCRHIHIFPTCITYQAWYVTTSCRDRNALMFLSEAVPAPRHCSAEILIVHVAGLRPQFSSGASAWSVAAHKKNVRILPLADAPTAVVAAVPACHPRPPQVPIAYFAGLSPRVYVGASLSSIHHSAVYIYYVRM